MRRSIMKDALGPHSLATCLLFGSSGLSAVQAHYLDVLALEQLAARLERVWNAAGSAADFSPVAATNAKRRAQDRPQPAAAKIERSDDFSGEPCRIRTCDPLIKSQLLYQLS